MYSRFRNTFLQNKVFFFASAAIVWGIILFVIDVYTNQFSNKDFFTNLLFNAHGMMFDLVVLGILLTIYDSITVKRTEIERLKNDIDDLRFWESDEAKFRIVGCIKRLNKLHHYQIDLSDCNLSGMNLENVNLEKSILNRTNLLRVNFHGACLRSVNFTGANLFECDLRNADLTNSNLSFANLNGADLRSTVFTNCILSIKSLINAKVASPNWFDELSRFNVKGLDIIKRRYKIDKLANGWMTNNISYQVIRIDDSSSDADDRM